MYTYTCMQIYPCGTICQTLFIMRTYVHIMSGCCIFDLYQHANLASHLPSKNSTHTKLMG